VQHITRVDARIAEIKKHTMKEGFLSSGVSLRARIGDEIFARHALHFALTLFAANASAR
jgi:hypothetical protein